MQAARLASLQSGGGRREATELTEEGWQGREASAMEVGKGELGGGGDEPDVREGVVRRGGPRGLAIVARGPPSLSLSEVQQG